MHRVILRPTRFNVLATLRIIRSSDTDPWQCCVKTSIWS